MDALFNHCFASATLQHAWETVKAKASAGGIDKMSVEMFDSKSAEYLDELRRSLQGDTYVPEPYQLFLIPKDDNEFRKLGLPTVKDKIVQVAVRQGIEPLFEKQFSDFSYGYRPGRGPVKAIRRVQHRIQTEGHQWATIMDIDSFFDTINPELLFNILGQSLPSPAIMKLIRLWVKIGTVNFRFKYYPHSEGIPQGAILSPLFSNVYLNGFDSYLHEKKYAPVRYADDFVIFTHTEQQAKQAYYDARHYLQTQLKLKLNPEWKVIRADSGFEFLHILFHNGQLSLTRERHEHILSKIEKAFDIQGELPDQKKCIMPLIGISAYYGKLLGQPTLAIFDEHMFQVLEQRMPDAVLNKKLLNQGQIESFLKELPFFSAIHQGSRDRTIRDLRMRITAAIKKQKLATKKLTVDQEVDKAIEKKRKKYEQLADAGRELVITNPGQFLGKTAKGITLKQNGRVVHTVPLHNLQNITILSSGISLSDHVIKHCAENSIPVDFIGFSGLPYAKIFTPFYPGAQTGLAQLAALTNGRGIAFVKSAVTGKLKNQQYLIKYYHKYRKNTDDDYNDAYEKNLATLKLAIEKIDQLEGDDLAVVRASVMGYEGTAATSYWEMIIRLLNEYTSFTGRERQGATDQVNSMLNYGYGILYSRVWEAVIRAHLNPHISYLHSASELKPTLAFDLIEEFRQQAVDKVVFSMISKGEEITMEKGLLSAATRNRLVEKILERLNKKENFRGHPLRLQEIIRHQAQALVKHLLGQKNYKPYVAKW